MDINEYAASVLEWKQQELDKFLVKYNADVEVHQLITYRVGSFDTHVLMPIDVQAEGMPIQVAKQLFPWIMQGVS